MRPRRVGQQAEDVAPERVASGVVAGNSPSGTRTYQRSGDGRVEFEPVGARRCACSAAQERVGLVAGRRRGSTASCSTSAVALDAQVHGIGAQPRAPSRGPPIAFARERDRGAGRRIGEPEAAREPGVRAPPGSARRSRRARAISRAAAGAARASPRARRRAGSRSGTRRSRGMSRGRGQRGTGQSAALIRSRLPIIPTRPASLRPFELFVGLRYTRAKRRTHFISFISLDLDARASRWASPRSSR